MLQPADLVLFRSLCRTVRALQSGPQLWHGIYSGVIRRTQRSQAFANLQSQATSIGSLASAFKAGGAAAITLPALAAISASAVPRRGSSTTATDTAFEALRQLSILHAALAALEADGTFAPMRRTPAVQFCVGQRLQHATLGPCVVYGWDHTSSCVEPQTAAALERAGGQAGLVDNRRTFVGLDADADAAQPWYRVQMREGRGHYCAQSNLRAVPRDEAFRVPIRGTSFFFVRADPHSGCLVARPELAQRYPDDEEMRVRGAVAIGG
jgi:hypothetical protein